LASFFGIFEGFFPTPKTQNLKNQKTKIPRFERFFVDVRELFFIDLLIRRKFKKKGVCNGLIIELFLK